MRGILGLFLLLILSGCAIPRNPISPAKTASLATATSAQASAPTQCKPVPIKVPTKPAVIPGYTELDPSTGLHMTGTVQEIDVTGYRLKVDGKVDNPLSLSYDALRCMPKVTAKPILTCKGNFEDVATWSGVPLKYVLNLAGVQHEAQSVKLIGADGYQAFTLLAEAMREDNFLAYEWEGQPVPILHGFPVRAVMPSMFGSAWTKWLVEILVQ